MPFMWQTKTGVLKSKFDKNEITLTSLAYSLSIQSLI